MHATQVDPLNCPICGAQNDCAVARGKGACWCFSSEVPYEVLERIPVEARNRACVCKSCAGGKREPSAVFQRLQQILRQRSGY